MTQNVFILDDEDDLRGLIVRSLVKKGFKVEDYATVSAIIDKLNSGARPDIMILDYNLPDGSALDVLQLAGFDPRECNIIVISGSLGVKESCLEHGADAFIPKPIRMSNLFAVIDTLTT